MAIVTDIANFYPLRADVDDDTASANNGTNTGVSFIAGGAGFDVADFNGTSDRFTTPNQVNDPFSVEITSVSLWLKSTASGATAVAVGSHYTSGGATNPVYALYLTAAGLPWLLIRSNGGTLVQATATTAINDGLWHNVIFTRTATQIEVFVDGVSEATAAAVGFGVLNNNNVLGVGCWVSIPVSNVATFYQGQMSDLAAWRRVLSGAEITQIHAAGVGQLASLMQLEAQGLFASVVHDLPTGPPIYARTLFASVVHSGIVNPIAARGLFGSVVHDDGASAGGDSPRWQGQSIQGLGLQGQNLQPSKDLA